MAFFGEGGMDKKKTFLSFNIILEESINLKFHTIDIILSFLGINFHMVFCETFQNETPQRVVHNVSPLNIINILYLVATTVL